MSKPKFKIDDIVIYQWANGQNFTISKIACIVWYDDTKEFIYKDILGNAYTGEEIKKYK